MKKGINLLFVGVFGLLVASPLVAVAAPVQASAAGESCETTILGIPPWFRGLANDDCSIKSPNDVGGISNFVWRIALNIIQIALGIIGYIAVFFIIYGGFLFITGGSNPSQVEKGRKAVFNAVIGLVIALGAVAIVNFIFGLVAGGTTNANGVHELSGTDLLHNILNVVYFALGTVSVIVVVLAGLSYITAAGDASKITRAKNMLTYAIAGLVIAFIAFAITGFVIERFS